jgi:hypothetical protein
MLKKTIFVAFFITLITKLLKVLNTATTHHSTADWFRFDSYKATHNTDRKQM